MSRLTARPSDAILTLAALLLLCAGPALGQPAGEWEGRAEPALGPRLNQALAAVAQGRGLGAGLRWRQVGGETLVDVIVQTTQPAAVPAHGGRVRSVLRDMVTAEVPLSRLPALSRAAGVRRVWAARRAWPTLDVSVPEINADAVHGGSPPNMGTGVVVGVVDTGLDWAHLDFVVEAGGQSRILYLWDQTLTPIVGETSPLGYGYGVEYTRAQITDEVDGSPTGFVRQQDTSGHGTHVTGIAGGDGSATGNGYPAGRYVGAAPDADLIVVKTDFLTSNIIDGVDYIFQRAGGLGQPAVVNLSLGDDLGPHDGTDPFELALSSLVGPGRIVVVSAGNSADDDIHAADTVPPHANTSVGFATAAGATEVYFDIWYGAADTMRVRVHRPTEGATQWVKAGQVRTFTGPDGTVDVQGETTSPANGDHQIFFTITSPVASSAWSFELRRGGQSSGDGSFDAWTVRSSGSWFTSSLSTATTVSTPGTASSTISVGAYVTKTAWTDVTGTPRWYGPGVVLGDICAFSGLGPSRDGRTKPDLAAPGQGIASALASGVNPGFPIIVEDGVHWVTQGTSQAAPHVAGTVALMLYRDRGLTPAEALSLLAGSGRTDAYTGSVPNNTWGAGKLDALGAAGATPAVVLARFLGLEPLSDGQGLLRWQVPAAGAAAGCHLYTPRPGGSRRLNDALLEPTGSPGMAADFATPVPLPADWYLVELVGLDGKVLGRERLRPDRDPR
ncbi:MAG: S8 family serine peptidase [Armatimonadota bacterium]